MKLIAGDANNQRVAPASKLPHWPRTIWFSHPIGFCVDHKRSVILLLRAIDSVDLDHVLTRPQPKTLVSLQVQRYYFAGGRCFYSLNRIRRLSINDGIDSFVSNFVCRGFSYVNLDCV